MRLRDRRSFRKPEVMIIPMIDIMFFLLVFFMLSTLYMVDLKTIPVNMPKVENAQTQTNVNYLVTLKADGTLYLEDQPIDEETLIENAKVQYSQNENFAAPGIHEYRGIANSVLGLRKPAPFTHIQGDAHGFPGYTSVGTAADSDVNIVLQVETRNMSDIIYADQ